MTRTTHVMQFSAFPLQGPVQAPLQGPWIAEYVEYVDGYDPSPQNYGDGYSICPEYEGFWEEYAWELEIQPQLIAETA